MKKLLLFSIVILLLIGCKNEPKETPAPTLPVAEETLPPPAPKFECYLYNANGSIVSLDVNYEENSVYGSLTYRLKEKDANTGTFTGKIENDILIADYKFQSEGMESMRQVAFQLKDGKAVEGYGEMTEDGTKFKDVSKLQFDSTMPLSSHDCPKN